MRRHFAIALAIALVLAVVLTGSHANIFTSKSQVSQEFSAKFLAADKLSVFSKMMNKRNSDLPEECAELYMNASASGCLQMFEDLVNSGEPDQRRSNPNKRDLGDVTQAELEEYCKSTCPDEVYKAFRCVAEYIDDSEWDADEYLAYINDFYCLHDDKGNYCAITFNKLGDVWDGENWPASKESLDQICVPCLDITIDYLVKFQEDPFAKENNMTFPIGILEATCIKENGEYCVIPYQETFSSCGGGDELDVMCLGDYTKELCEEQCVMKVLSMQAYYPESEESAEEINTFIDNICLKHTSGSYCVSEYAKWESNYTSTCTDEKLPQLCSDPDCDTAIHSFIGELGCCAEPMLMLSGMENDIEESCDITYVAPCAKQSGTKVVSKSISTPYDYDWINKNRNTFDPAFIADISRSMGTDKDFISILSISKNKGVIIARQLLGAQAKVGFSIKGRDDAHTNSLSTNFDTMAANNEIKFLETDQVAEKSPGDDGDSALGSSFSAVAFIALAVGAFVLQY